jgi:hypothetical protein
MNGEGGCRLVISLDYFNSFSSVILAISP